MDLRDFRLLEFVEHPVFVLAPDHLGVPRYVAYNDHACRRVGRPECAFLGRTAKECFPGEFGDVVYGHHIEALKTGHERAYEVLMPQKDGPMLIRTLLKPVLDDAGRVTHLVGSSGSISARQVVRSDAALFRRDADAETFIAMAAHELRSPLRNIGEITEMLREENPSPSESETHLFEHFERLYTTLSDHINDILAHANALEAAEEDVVFSLGDMLEQIMLVQDPLGLCKVSVTDTRIRGDRSGIQIVLGCLIDNAIKHAQPAGGALSLDVVAHQDSRGFVAVRLSDNGLGFNEPALMLLDNGKLRPDSGFGLFGIRRLIHGRGGRLLVTRAADRSGASITFSLRGEILADAVSFDRDRAVRG